MADEADRANDLAQQLLDAALAQKKARGGISHGRMSLVRRTASRWPPLVLA